MPHDKNTRRTTGDVGDPIYTYGSLSTMGVAANTELSPTRVVLVVEDDEDCRETISETLQDAGYSVTQLVDAEQALSYLLERQTLPAGIVLDLWLPGMSGRELLAVLKDHPRLSVIPVVLTSAGRPCGAESAVDASWLPKPFDAENLLAAVSAQCSAAAPRAGTHEPSSGDCGEG